MPAKKVKSEKLKVKSLNRKGKTTQEARTSKKTKVAAKTRENGLSVSVYGKDGKVVGKVKFPNEMFAAKVNDVLMAQAVRVYLANQRSGTAGTKTRGEVRGSTRKIYRQKGTGKARHGAITAPIFVGGGIVFGPRPRDFSLKLPKRMKRQALFSALTQKFKDNKILVIDKIQDLKPKTREFVKIIKGLGLVNKNGEVSSILFILPGGFDNLERSARNIEGVEIEKANLLNTYEVLNSQHLLFLKGSIEVLEKTFLKNPNNRTIKQ